jgi:hypothetical protein
MFALTLLLGLLLSASGARSSEEKLRNRLGKVRDRLQNVRRRTRSLEFDAQIQPEDAFPGAQMWG